MEHNYAAGFRGFGEQQARGLREILVDEKAVAFDAFQNVEAGNGGALQAVLERVGIETSEVLTVPVQGPDQEAGVLWLLADGRPFDPDECERARIVAAHADAVAAGRGIVLVDGRLVENLHVEDAHRVIALADAIARLLP